MRFREMRLLVCGVALRIRRAFCVYYVRERIQDGCVLCGEDVEIGMVVTMQGGGTRENHGSGSFQKTDGRRLTALLRKTRGQLKPGRSCFGR
jgi:hypothetical protein